MIKIPSEGRHRRSSVDITLLLHASCNYGCYYCCAKRGSTYPGVKLDDNLASKYLAFLDSFEAERKTVRINAYGEPTRIPGIWNFLPPLSERAKVMLATNLTFNLSELYRALPPESTLFLLTSLHPETELDVAGFVRKCLELLSKGYEVIVHYMVDDGRIDDAERYRALMRKEGIPFFLSPIQGETPGKVYPFDYETHTKSFLLANMEEMHPQLLVRYKDLAFTGMMCSAGYDTFCIRGKAVSPCMNSDRLLGWVDGDFSPYDQPYPCTALHARSQCLPDHFLPNSRTYCMGNHKYEVAPRGLAEQIDAFADIYERVVSPARKKEVEEIALRISTLATRRYGKIFAAFLGVPMVLYLPLLLKHLVLDGLVSDDPVESWGLSVISSEEYFNSPPGSGKLVLLHGVHGAHQAIQWLGTARQSKRDDVIVIGDLPAAIFPSGGGTIA